jgi:peptidoglycan/LPS O-acetylase OafA/YrhL
MNYRADIEGLRAVAVIAVVAFHVGVPLVKGGFVGVDVFFVISGFLLTRLISKDVDEGCFSLAKFYERRVRRILPALIVLVAALWIFGLLFWTSYQLVSFSRESLAATLAVSNFLFWSEAGYFDVSALDDPLLHTWSLGIEEQFYLLLPFIFLVSKRQRSWVSPKVIIAMLAAISLALNFWMARYAPEAAFFLLPARAWELLLGSLIALRTPPSGGSLLAKHGSLLGMVLVLAPIFLARDTGLSSVFGPLSACVGTALIVAAGPSDPSSVSALLATKIPRFIGRISYSVYLWHWPLIAILEQLLFLRHPMPAAIQALVVGAASLGMGYVSWRYIETPFRSKYQPRYILSGACFAIVVSIFVSLFVTLLDGIPSRFPPDQNALGAHMMVARAPVHLRSGVCFIWSGSAFSQFRPDQCVQEVQGAPNYLIVGDSHAAHLWVGLSTVFRGINWMQATASGCLPARFATGADRCVKMMHFVFDEFLLTHRVDRLILSARWEWRLTELAQTIDWAKTRDIPLLLVGPIAEYDAPLPRLLLEASRLNEPGLPARHLVLRRSLDLALASLAKEKGIPYASLQDVLCDHGACEQWAAAGVPMQYDRAHLTMEGSIFVAKALKDRGLGSAPIN